MPNPTISIVRLMSWPAFKTKKAKPEETLCRDFANELRGLTLDGNLRGVWTHVPNEIGWGNNRISQMIYACAKSMGMIVGASDYVFLGPNGALALEAKSSTGQLHAGQKDFRQWCAEQEVPYEVFRTVEEGLTHLRTHGFI